MKPVRAPVAQPLWVSEAGETANLILPSFAVNLPIPATVAPIEPPDPPPAPTNFILGSAILGTSAL